jgi:hypothetical protein
MGTFILDAEPYRLAARALGHLGRSLQRELGVSIETLDLGGGFASRNTLHGQYLPGEEAAPSFAQYVERIAAGIDEAYQGAEPPRLVLETGRALVDDAGLLVSTVLGNKRLGDCQAILATIAGVGFDPRLRASPAHLATGAALAVLLAAGAQPLLGTVGLPAYTLPFVAAHWLLALVARRAPAGGRFAAALAWSPAPLRALARRQTALDAPAAVLFQRGPVAGGLVVARLGIGLRTLYEKIKDYELGD